MIVLIVVGACGVIGLVGIAILAAVLVPSFATAREAARKSLCMSRAKQMSTSLLMYAQDYDQRLPPTRSWQTAVAPYGAGDVNVCPSRPGASPAYAFNQRLSGKSITTIQALSTAPTIFESSLGAPNAADQLESFVTPHRDEGMIGFGDGSVRALSAPPNEPMSSIEE
ncbi:MAG: hypothetical protein ACO1SX_06015 [Actinomycetota bacterium]